MKLNTLLALLVLSLSVGCSTSNAASKDATQVAINNAKQARKSAKAVGFEWRDMGKMIKKAEAAAKSGNNKKAIKLANMVVKQGQQAQLQAKRAKTAGPRF